MQPKVSLNGLIRVILFFVFMVLMSAIQMLLKNASKYSIFLKNVKLQNGNIV